MRELTVRRPFAFFPAAFLTALAGHHTARNLRRLRHAVTACLAVAAIVAANGPMPSLAQAPGANAPTINYLTPSAVKPGETVDVTVVGTNLASPTATWTNLPAQVELAPLEKNGTDKTKVVYRITLPADAAPAIAGLRIATGDGVSNLRLLMVDELDTVQADGKNRTPETALAIKPPVAVEGAVAAESFDYYRLEVAAGQELSFEVFAARLGSPLDPVLRLLDSDGRELAYSDDEDGLSSDSRFRYRFEKAGSYLLEIRDIRYAGNASHRYRIRIGDFPLVSTTFPLAVSAGKSAEVQPAGVSAELPAVTVTPEAADQGRRWVAVSAAAAAPQAVSAMAAYEVSAVPELLEQEPNDELAASEAQPLPIPAGWNGRFDRAGDRDHFTFEGKKGQRLVFRGHARELGSPADLFMRLYQADGKKLAEVDDTDTAEGILTITLPADGRYVLAVEDLLRRGGPAFAYRVAAEIYQPSFTLALDADRFNVPQGGVFVTKVTATRNGYDGPITLALEGAPEGTKLEANTIAEKKNDTTLKVTLPDSVPGGTLLTCNIIGQAKHGEQELTAVANALAVWRTAVPRVPYPSGELVETVAVGIGPKFPAFFELAVDDRTVNLTPGLDSGRFQVKAKRLNKFDDAIALAVEGLPSGFAAKAEPIAKGKNDIAVTVSGPADAMPGEHPFKVVGKATYQNQPQQVTLGELVLKVAPALQLRLAGPAVVEPGKTARLKLTLQRGAEQVKEVSLAIKDLPPGVSAPEKLSAAADQTELEIELTAAADAKSGEAAKVQVTAQVKVGDQTITAASNTVEVKVQ